MFVLLNIVPEQNKKKRFRKKQNRPVISVKRISPDTIAPFFVMNCERYRGIVPFNTISAMSGHLNKKFVLPRNIEIPPGADIAPYKGNRLRDIMLVNTAAEILKAVCADRRKIELTVIDLSGELSGFIEPLVMLSGRIKVITEKTEKYDGIAERLMTEYGIRIILSNQSRFTETGGIIISPDSGCISPYFKGVLFTNSEENPECSLAVRGEGADISAYYDKPLPDGVDSMDMAEALYSLCFASELEKGSFLKLYVSRAERAYEEAAEVIGGFINRVCG